MDYINTNEGEKEHYTRLEAMKRLLPLSQINLDYKSINTNTLIDSALLP